MNIPNYSMYTDAGNHAVDAIVRSARILKLTWPQVHQELRSLAERFPEDFGEATDTAVRECVYQSLTYCTDPFYGDPIMDNATKVRELESAIKLLTEVDAIIQTVFGSTDVGEEYYATIGEILYDLRSDIDTIRALYGA